MKIHTVLLVACLTTVPAVAAENPFYCKEDPETGGGHCSVTAPPASDAGTASEGCQALYLWYQLDVLPVGATINPECIVGP